MNIRTQYHKKLLMYTFMILKKAFISQKFLSINNYRYSVLTEKVHLPLFIGISFLVNTYSILNVYPFPFHHLEN